jgi:hypothetical protein
MQSAALKDRRFALPVPSMKRTTAQMEAGRGVNWGAAFRWQSGPECEKAGIRRSEKAGKPQ